MSQVYRALIAVRPANARRQPTVANLLARIFGDAEISRCARSLQHSFDAVFSCSWSRRGRFVSMRKLATEELRAARTSRCGDQFTARLTSVTALS